MSTKDVESRAGKPDSFEGSSERNSRRPNLGASKLTAIRENPSLSDCFLMEAVLGKDNMKMAYKRVIGNKGAPGVDEMTTEELEQVLKKLR